MRTVEIYRARVVAIVCSTSQRNGSVGPRFEVVKSSKSCTAATAWVGRQA